MPHIYFMEPLAQMFRSIESQKRTGLLQIEQVREGSRERGEIYFEYGRPVRAQAGSEAGRKAFHYISKWKQIICSFQSMSRPYSEHAQTLTREQTRNEREEISVHPLSDTGPQTGDLVPYAHLLFGKQVSQESTSLPSVENYPPDPDMQLTELMDLARTSTTSRSARLTQPLVLQGETLKTFTPPQPEKTSAAVRRWTTHLVPETKPLNKPAQQEPLQPTLPSPKEELKPGPLAIFKARAMVMTTRIIQLMERRERVIFILLDGERTIRHIARLTHHTEFEVEQILLQLMKKGYAEYIRG